MSSCLLVLPSGKWFKLPCFDHLFSLRAHTQARKVKTVPQKTGSVLQTINFLEGGKKKKVVGKNALLQTICSSSCFLLLLFPWQLVEADFTALLCNILRHQWGLLDSGVSQDMSCPGETSCCCSYFGLKSSPPQAPSLVLMEAQMKSFAVLEAWVSQVPASW